MCKNLRVFGIESFVRYSFGIMGILGFYDFVIFPSRCNALMLQSCTLYFQE